MSVSILLLRISRHVVLWLGHRANTFEEWSPNLSTEYPFLCEKLQNELGTRELLLLSLGPDQSFYSKWQGYSWWKLPTAITNKVQEVQGQGITAVALGMDESYVIVHGNKWSWDLKGNYNGLRDVLKSATSAPRVRPYLNNTI